MEECGAAAGVLWAQGATVRPPTRGRPDSWHCRTTVAGQVCGPLTPPRALGLEAKDTGDTGSTEQGLAQEVAALDADGFSHWTQASLNSSNNRHKLDSLAKGP